MFDLSQYGSQIAILHDSGTSLTYSQLENEANSLIASVNHSNGLAFILCENEVASVMGYIAFINGHIPAVLLDAHKDFGMIKNLMDIYQPDYLWIPQERSQEFGGKVVYEYQGYILVAPHYAQTIQKVIHPELALCLTTSGSTGSPKLVRLSATNLLSNAKSIASYLNITADERPITSLPMYYSYGLSVINSHLLMGSTILLTSKAVIQKDFWQFAREQAATSISGVPFTYEMLRRLRIFNMDLPALKTMTQAGGKLNVKIAQEYITNAAKFGKRFIIMYGQTEATARMSYLPAEQATEKFASIGIAIPGGKFSLEDAQGREINEAEVDGELVYRGDNVSLGYAECIADLAKGDENHKILHTGDIARRDADGFYYITGRLKRFVKVWGNRCNLDATEQLVKSITTQCACAGIDDRITVFVTENGLNEPIIAMLSDKMGLNPRAFTVKVIDHIPINAAGKVQYAELQKMID